MDVAAGGTGGHLFPAESLSAALARRGIATALATDSRAAKYSEHFKSMYVVPSETFRGRDPISIARAGAVLAFGLARAVMLMRRVKPSVVVGFGGYPSVPPVFAASLLKIPTVLHEQNAVMGRANRFLASRVTAIATGFAGVTDKDKALAIKTTCIGNPLRPAVIAAADTPYEPAQQNGPLRMLVFGGSQGARIMADIVPPAVSKLEPHLQMRLKITQQVREEDIPRVREIYARAQVAHDIAPFFSDLPARMVASTSSMQPIFEAIVEDGTGRIKCVFFGQAYLKESLKVGRRVVLYGAPEWDRYGGGLALHSPDVEILDDADTDSATLPVFGTRSANNSLDSVMLSPTAMPSWAIPGGR